MITLIKATIVILVGCYFSSSPDIFSKEKDKFSMKIYGVEPWNGKKEILEGWYNGNIYEISQSCLDGDKIEIMGSAKNVTISIECKGNGKRIYYRKGQTIKGVYKIPFNEIGTDECNIDDETVVSEETELDKRIFRLQVIKNDSLDEREIIFDCFINSNCSANSAD